MMGEAPIKCGDCGWCGLEADWRAGCKGSPCELGSKMGEKAAAKVVQEWLDGGCRSWNVLCGAIQQLIDATRPIRDEAVVEELDACTLLGQNVALREALELFVTEYVQLVESGDAGFWNAEEEPKVIKARAALVSAGGLLDEAGR